MRFHWVLCVVGYESSLNSSIAFWRALVVFQDLKFVAFCTVDFDSQGLDVEFFEFTPTEN